MNTGFSLLASEMKANPDLRIEDLLREGYGYVLIDGSQPDDEHASCELMTFGKRGMTMS